MLLPAKPYYLVFSKPFHAKEPAACTALWLAIATMRGSVAWRNRLG